MVSGELKELHLLVIELAALAGLAVSAIFQKVREVLA